eukprot:gb/GECG01001838.1/.p1 GENE.gb/GECG01001838.1/~~gb/GECG01001838.1/.p1  ORF type:complete len:104 (+),score=11.39 gb/GECG01001838.1/:1-312(+)
MTFHHEVLTVEQLCTLINKTAPADWIAHQAVELIPPALLPENIPSSVQYAGYLLDDITHPLSPRELDYNLGSHQLPELVSNRGGTSNIQPIEDDAVFKGRGKN